MSVEKTDKVLQSQQRLLWRAHKAEMQPETVEVGSPALVHRRQVVHRDGRLPADPLRVVTDELDRLFPAEDVDRVLLLQIPDQSEILLQDFVSRRVPARIDNENAKARCRDFNTSGIDPPRWRLGRAGSGNLSRSARYSRRPPRQP